MENAYSKGLNLPENLIFLRDQGAAWDLFTIGFYRDLGHYAESAGILPAKQEAAAKAAGFDSASQSGPYLRRFIATHHDTLAVALTAPAMQGKKRAAHAGARDIRLPFRPYHTRSY